jgi:hypothetical protein
MGETPRPKDKEEDKALVFTQDGKKNQGTSVSMSPDAE